MTGTALRRLGAVLLLVVSAPGAGAAELQPETAADFAAYATGTEQRIGRELESGGPAFLAREFLPADAARRCRAAVEGGRVCVEPLETRDASGQRLAVRHGLVHHWLGAVRVSGVELEALLAWLQDYDHHAGRFPEVEASRLLDRDGDQFDVRLQLVRKKVITVRYLTDHHAVYRRHGDTCASSRSVATRIVELDDGAEREGNRGFLWRMNSYWRFRQVGDAVEVEVESLSLSRDVPRALAWLVNGIVADLPRESLTRTLLAVRNGMAPRTGQKSGQGPGDPIVPAAARD